MSDRGVESSVQVMEVDSDALTVALVVKFTVTTGVSKEEEGMEMQVLDGGSQGCCCGEA